MIELLPDNPLGYYNLGGAYLGLGRYEDAIAILKKGLNIEPNWGAWTDLGSAYMYLGKYEEAADAMQRAADLSPHNHVMWRNLGEATSDRPGPKPRKWAYQKALETAAAQLKVNPKDPEVLSGIALYYAHFGRASEAQKLISRAAGCARKQRHTIYISFSV